MAGVPPRFACDAMLRGLARWLRACGYDASWEYGVEDAALLEQARQEGRVLLTSDHELAARRAVREGRPRGLHVPNDLPPVEQAVSVLARLALPVRPARCMACGGALQRVDKASVAGEAPPRTFARVEVFFRCRRCGRLLWQGTHWTRIAARRADLAARLAAGREDG